MLRWQLVLLTLYSIGILTVEYVSGQSAVRHYVTDIDATGLFYGINTTISTVLLVLCAYNFWLCFRVSSIGPNHSFPAIFYLLQILVFTYLALDERFMLHERAAFVLGFHDGILLVTVGLFQLFVLYKFEALKKDSPGFKLLLTSAILFAIMLLIDAAGDSIRPLRLSIEDLCKLWAIFVLFLYSLKHLKINSTIPKAGN